MPNTFPPPWSVRRGEEAYWVEAANGMTFGYCYFREERAERTVNPARMTEDEARRIVTNFAKLPQLLRRA